MTERKGKRYNVKLISLPLKQKDCFNHHVIRDSGNGRFFLFFAPADFSGDLQASTDENQDAEYEQGEYASGSYENGVPVYPAHRLPPRISTSLAGGLTTIISDVANCMASNVADQNWRVTWNMKNGMTFPPVKLVGCEWQTR